MILLDVLCLAAASVLHLRFTARLTGKHFRKRYASLYFLLLCAIYAVSAAFGLGSLPAAGMEMLALYATARLALMVPPSGAWTAAILAVYVSQLSFGLVDSLESILITFAAKPPVLRPVILLSALSSLVLCACCYRLILKCLEKADETPYTGLLFLPGLFASFVELYLLNTVYSTAVFPITPADSIGHLALLFLQALGLGALLCTLYAYRHFCRNLQAQASLASLTQAARAQQVYAAQAMLRYEKTRAFRHDVKNHLSVLSGLLKSGQHQEAEAYLEKLEAASASLTPAQRTGNPVVDILLGEKLEAAAACGITAEVSLRLPAAGGLDDFDLCVIFANALDNAITACQAAPHPRSIRIRGERQGDFCLLVFENACLEGPLPEEGTGLSNIRTAAEKYGGTARAEKSGTQFRLSVLLNINGCS